MTCPRADGIGWAPAPDLWAGIGEWVIDPRALYPALDSNASLFLTLLNSQPNHTNNKMVRSINGGSSTPIVSFKQGLNDLDDRRIKSIRSVFLVT